MSTENLEQEDQNRTTEPIIDIPGNEAPADPEQEIVSQGVHNYSFLGIKRQGFRLVPPPGKLDGRRNLQKTVFQPKSFV